MSERTSSLGQALVGYPHVQGSHASPIRTFSWTAESNGVE